MPKELFVDGGEFDDGEGVSVRKRFRVVFRDQRILLPYSEFCLVAVLAIHRKIYGDEFIPSDDLRLTDTHGMAQLAYRSRLTLLRQGMRKPRLLVDGKVGIGYRCGLIGSAIYASKSLRQFPNAIVRDYASRLAIRASKAYGGKVTSGY